MQQIISRVKTRRGLEGELKLKVFDTGELIVANDTKRLLVGDGVNVAGASLTPKFYKADSVEDIKSRIFEGDFALIDNRLYVAKKTGFSATSFSIADFEEITPTPDGVTINYNPAGEYEVVDLSIGAAKINASVAGSGLIKLNDAAGLSVYKDDDFFDFDVDGRLTLSNDAKSTIKFVPQSLTEMEKMIARNNIGVTAGGGGGGGGDTSVLESMLVDEINARIAADNAIGVTLTSHTNSLALKAPLASPAFTGTPTAPTASPGDVSTKLATTEFVSLVAASLTSTLATKAPLDSAALTGTPTAPTPPLVDSSTRIATTAFVHGVEGVVSSQISALSTRVATLEGGSYDNIQSVPFIDLSAFIGNVDPYDVQPGDGVKTQDGAINVLRKDGVKTIITDWIEIKVPDSVLSGLTSAVSVLQGEVMGLASLQLNSFESNGWTITYGGDTATVIPYASASTTGVLNKTDFAIFASKAAGTHTHTIADVTNLQTTLNGKSDVGHLHAIADVTDLQLTLDGKAAASHTHAIANITGLQTALDGKALIAHAHTITDVTGLQTALDSKAAATHVHIIGDVTGLQAALDGKSAVGHTHAISDVVNLQTTLDGKAAAVHAHAITDITGLSAALAGKAASVHTHAIADVTNLQTTLDAKAAAVHTHAISDVLTLQTTLDGKAPTVHSHAITDVTGLQLALDGKAAASHTHAISDVTGLQLALDGKAGVTHTHAIADVTNLQTSLDGKAASIHTHAIADVTGLQAALDAAGGNTVKYDVQTLTTPQKNQARTNIGATGLFTVTQNTNDITLSDGGSLNVSLPEVTATKAGLMSASDKNLINSLAAAGGAVLYSSVQGLDSTQKLTARTNIDAASTASVAAKLDTSTFNSYTSTNDATVTNLSNKTVRVDTTSSFTFDERAQARTNIAVRDSGMVYNNADLNLLNTESILDADITSATSLVSFNGTLPNATFGPVIFFVQAGVLKVTYPTLSQTDTIATLGKGLSIVVSGNRVAFFDVTNGNTTLFDNTYASLASYTPGIVGFTGVLRRAANSAIELSGAQRMKFMSGGYWGETTTNMVNVFGPAGISDSGYWVSHTNSLLSQTKGSPLVLNGNNVSVRFLASASSTSIPGAQSGVSQYEFSIPVTYGTSNSSLTVCDTNLPTGLFVMGANYDHASQTAKIRVMNLNYDAVSVTTIGWLQITV